VEERRFSAALSTQMRNAASAAELPARAQAAQKIPSEPEPWNPTLRKDREGSGTRQGTLHFGLRPKPTQEVLLEPAEELRRTPMANLRVSSSNPEQEAQLSEIARHAGTYTETERVVKEAALRLLQEDGHFRASVRKGLEQANRGQFVEEREMEARIDRMLES
jgi:predicted transcriptional regulator